MKITKTITVPREVVFEKIIESCLYDIKKQVGKAPKLHSLNGYSYVKDFGRGQTGKIKFDQIKEPELYAFTTTTDKATFHTEWALSPAAGGKTRVTITEDQILQGHMVWLKKHVVGGLMGILKRRQMSGTLDYLQRDYAKLQGK